MNKIANKSISFSLSTEIIKIQAISTEMKRKLIGTLLLGFRNFANKTFANYWRKSRGYTGESSLDIRQLAKVQRVYWRKFSGYSSIGESTGGTLANIQGMYW